MTNQLVDIRIRSGSDIGEAPLLVIGCFEGEAPPEVALPEPVRRAVERAAGRSGFRGKEKQRSDVTPEEGPVETVSLCGLGPREDLEPRKVAAWLDRVFETVRTNAVSEIALVLPDADATRGEAAAERICRALALGSYRFDRFKERADDEPVPLARVELVPPPGDVASFERMMPVAWAIAHGVAVARDLGNTPANVAHPGWMEERATELAREHGMEIRALQAAELEERGMGGVLAVGRGSERPPRLVRIDYGTEGPVVALVGKGVTFDTGGISIKPSANMDAMKYDKCGACAVLGALDAAARLELPVRLRAYLPFAENMPDGSAYRPGDILTMYDGTTVEVLNTDAEGRLLLADALAWAAEERPDALVELSTLTGACVVALGQHGGGLFTPDEGLAAELLAAAEAGGERLWRLPLWSEFLEEMQGNHADLKNAGGRWGGAATAAAFLSHFARDLDRWAHLDIAGPAQDTSERNHARGGTGYGVALVVGWLRRLAGA